MLFRSTDLRLSQVRQRLANGSTKVLSIDAFDTLLWRRVPEPGDVFLVLGDQLARAGNLAPEMVPVTFAELRRAAERAARAKVQAVTGYREVTLADIYDAMPAGVFADGFSQQAEAELACERGLLVADDAIVGLIADARSEIGRAHV